MTQCILKQNKHLSENVFRFPPVSENHPDPIIRYNAEGKRIWHNRMVEEMLKAAPVAEESSVMSPSSSKVEIYNIHLRQALRTGMSVELKFVMDTESGGGLREYRISFTPEFDGDTVSGVVVQWEEIDGGFGGEGRMPEKRHDLTGQRQLEDAVPDHERMLRNLMENLPGFVYTFRRLPNGSEGFVLVSAGCRDLCGVEPEALVADLSRLRNLMREEERADFHAAINESARSGEVFHREYRIQHPEKGERWLETRAVSEIYPDGSILWHGVTLDVSERKTYQLQAELVETAMRHSGEAIYVVDTNRDFRFIFVNEAACRMTGYTKAELLAMTPLELDSTVTRQRMMKVTDYLSSGKCLFHEGVHRRKDGSTFPVEIHSYRIVFNGETLRISIIRDITERKQHEDALAKRERDFRTLAENTPDPIYRYDRDCRRIYVNPAVERLTGLAAEELLGKTPIEKRVVVEGDDHKGMQSLQKVLKTAEVDTVEIRFITPDGRELCYEHTNVPEFGPDGAVESVLSIGRDITAIKRKKALIEELRESEARYQAKNALLQAVLESSPNIVTFALDQDYRYIAFDRQHAEIMRDLWGKDIALGDDMPALMGDHPNREVAKQSFDRALRGESFVVEQEYGDKDESRRAWDIHYAPIVSPAGEIIGCTCFNLDVSERKRSEREIALTSARLSTLFAAMPDLVWLKDPDGVYQTCNEAYARFLGTTSEDMLQKSDEDFYPPAAAQVCKQSDVAAIRAGRISFSEEQVAAADGTEMVFEIRKAPVYGGNGELEAVMGIARDITERKRMEEALAKREQDFRALAENSPDTIARFNGKCRRTYVNPAFERLFGRPSAEVLGKTPSVTTPIPGDLSQVFENRLREVLRTGEEFEMEAPFVNAEGGMGVGHVRLVPEFGEDGKVVSALSIGRDITERKRMEEVLAEREREFRTLAENSPNIIIRYDRDCRRIYVNPAYAQKTGISVEKAQGATPKMQWEKHLHMPRMSAEEYQERIRHVLESGESAQFTMEGCRLSDGVYVILEMHVVAERDANGDVIGALAIGHDITERKVAEDALARREREFRTLADNSPDVIVRYDKELKRVFVNAAWEKINRVAASEVLGKTPSEKCFQIAHMTNEFEAQLRQVLATGEGAQFDIEWWDQEGRGVVFNLKAVAEWDEGEIAGVLTFARDVTEQRLFQQTLALREQAFRALAENSPDTIARYDREARRIYANPTFARLSGTTPEAMVGQKPTDSNPSPDAAAYEAMLTTVFASGEMGEMEYAWPDAQGNKITSHVCAVPEYDGKGEVVSVLATGRDISKLLEIQRQMEHMARHDVLTGLPNRQTVREHTSRAIIDANRHGGKVALLFVDLDNFKAVNDSLGHATGDILLKEVAARLQSCVRKIDTVGRQGGDEFVITLCEVASVDSVEEVITRIFRRFEQPVPVAEHALFISVSIGVAIYPDDGDNFYTLLKRADTAMFDAKEAGRNTYSFFSGEMNQATVEHLRLHSDLKHALSNDELTLHYQPQIDAGTGRITGAEALLRWQHPEKGMIPPMSFIPVAEANGLIVPIGEWVLREACRQATRWQDGGGDPLNIAVNISAMQFKRGNLEETVLSALEQSGLAPERLELELTESILIHNTDQTLEMVKRLKARGIRISIDDFGTGYSSMSYLKRFAADTLKIDRSFVRDIVHDKDDAAIVRAIIQMAKGLGIATVAEGVEEQEHLDLLKDLGCDLIQGFYISRPLNKTDFDAFCVGWSAWK